MAFNDLKEIEEKVDKIQKENIALKHIHEHIQYVKDKEHDLACAKDQLYRVVKAYLENLREYKQNG